MKIIPHTLLFIISLCLATSCIQYGNDSAFYKVVDYYAGDSLKEKAALFLANNSRYHYGHSRKVVDSLGNPTNINYKGFDTDTLFLNHLLANGYKYETGGKVWDSDTITEDFLKENIELAFDSWQKPWSRSVSFEDFCRYILPYRNGDEELSDWRRKFKEKYEAEIEDSVDDITSIREVALFLMRRLKQDVKYGTRLGIFYGMQFLTPEEMERMHTMECKGLAHYGTLVLRACGVPCTTIETHWRFTEIVHTSILIPQTGTNNKACRLSIYDELQEMGAEKDSMASWRTWSYEYEPNHKLQELSKDKSIPSHLYDPVTRKDITDDFSTTYSFRRHVPKDIQKKRNIFLCRFHDFKWYPIREGIIENDSVLFEKATIRQLYRLGCFNGGELKTFGEVFTLLGDGRQKAYDNTGDTVMFKLVFNCEPEETNLKRDITAYRWAGSNESVEKGELSPVKGIGTLWGLNEKTGEYKIFEENMRKDFKPVFHLMEVHLPMWTAFTHNEFPRPLGFIVADSNTNEGYMMQF